MMTKTDNLIIYLLRLCFRLFLDDIRQKLTNLFESRNVTYQ